MKRLLIVGIALLLPMAAFAQLQVGGTAMYNYQVIGTGTPDDIDASDFTFGADARLRIWLFQGSALALFTPGYTDAAMNEVPANIDLFLDGGVSIDFLLFRFGLGLGPNFRVAMGSGDKPTGFGINVKGTAEVLLGGISLGLSYLNKFELDLSQAGDLLDADYSQGLIGISVLFEL